MKFRKMVWSLAALTLLPALSQAQQTSTAGKSPYASRMGSYSSLDNPYAPGGLYDPYRSSRSQSSHAAADVAGLNDIGSSSISLDSDRSACSRSRSLLKWRSADSPGVNQLSNFGNSTSSLTHLNRPFAASRDVPGGCSRLTTKSSSFGSTKPRFGSGERGLTNK